MEVTDRLAALWLIDFLRASMPAPLAGAGKDMARMSYTNEA
jgi:hypothetical protein